MFCSSHCKIRCSQSMCDSCLAAVNCCMHRYHRLSMFWDLEEVMSIYISPLLERFVREFVSKDEAAAGGQMFLKLCSWHDKRNIKTSLTC